MKSTSSPVQIAAGVVLGIVLQRLSLQIVAGYIMATTRPGTEARGWGLMGAGLLYFAYFGMVQVVTILPAALILLPTGKHGVVRGLLLVGTSLALLNVGVLIFLRASGWPIPG
jgi:hypothetical protein